MLHGKTLYLNASVPAEDIVAAAKALASVPRWRILQHLSAGRHSINDIAEALAMPASTVAAQVKILEEVGLVQSELLAASHGLQKVCRRTYDNVVTEFPGQRESLENAVEVAMPIGGYRSFDVTPTCGLASATALIGYLDEPLSFYEPAHLDAQLIWFRSGYLEYVFPNRLPTGAGLSGLQLSMEICSEAPLHSQDWPSDITLWVNGVEIGTWTSPADFGGRHGSLTPTWWSNKDSQHGLLKRWAVTPEAAYVDGHLLSSVTLDDLRVDLQRVITVRIGVKPDALHVGGLNLFGRLFGNYPQDLTLRLEYLPGRRPA